MRLGFVARADDTGLGNQSHEFQRHMEPDRTVVIDCSELNSTRPLVNHMDRYPKARLLPPSAFDYYQMTAFLDGLDAVFLCETPYNWQLIDLAHERRVKTILQYNYEFFPYGSTGQHPMVDIMAAPSVWHYNDRDVPFRNKIHLPVPVATDHFTRPYLRNGPATRFLHVVGHPAIHDRNGTLDLLNALVHIDSDVEINIRCMNLRYVPEIPPLPSNVRVTVDTSRQENYWDLYHPTRHARGYDVLIMPRRYGGLCLPMQEALAAGMPVIMPNISPNDHMLPPEWLTPATVKQNFMASVPITAYETAPEELAKKIDQFATDQTFYEDASVEAYRRAKAISWHALKPTYEKELLCW